MNAKLKLHVKMHVKIYCVTVIFKLNIGSEQKYAHYIIQLHLELLHFEKECRSVQVFI